MNAIKMFSVFLFACFQVWAAPKTEVIISTAASLTDAMTELVQTYNSQQSKVKITPTFGSSGSLQKQIEQGAPSDLFFSASPKQMNKLQAQGLIINDSRTDLLENKVVLIAPQKSTLKGFQDLTSSKVKQIALGEPSSVPAGQYAKEALTFMKIYQSLESKAVFAKNVRQVLAYVEMGEVDAGLVYATDAAIGKNIKKIAEAPQGSHSPVIYPVALIQKEKPLPEAKAFLNWLSSDQAAKIFRKYGFSVITH